MAQRLRRRAAGFSLVEILLALGIFAIGMIAVVSLLPVAALLQRETAIDVLATEVGDSAQAMVEVERLTYGGAGSGHLGGYHAANLNGEVSDIVVGRFPTADRAYPSAQVSGVDTSSCDFFWVPFIQDLNNDPANPNWTTRILILESDSQADYTIATGSGIAEVANGATIDPGSWVPKVVRTTCSLSDRDTFVFNVNAESYGLQGGDLIMDSNGNNYIIAEVDGANVTVTYDIVQTPAAPNSVWFAPALGGSSSPLKRIITVAPNVTAP